MLEVVRVGEHQDRVGQDDEPRLPVEREGTGVADDGEHDGRDPCRAHGQQAGGDRAVALARMRAVALDVVDVVHEIVGARDQAEAGEGDERLEELRDPGRGVAEVVLLAEREHEREEDDAVLRPLARAHGAEEIAEPGDGAAAAGLEGGRDPLGGDRLGGAHGRLVVGHMAHHSARQVRGYMPAGRRPMLSVGRSGPGEGSHEPDGSTIDAPARRRR